MPLTPAGLAAKAEKFHALAEAQLRTHGKATTILVFVADNGEASVLPLPTGELPSTAHAAQIARATRAVALILTGEVWTATSTLAPDKAADLPFADQPAPSEQTDRGEALATLAVCADATVLRRATVITRGAFGPTLSPQPTGDLPARPDGLSGLLGQILAAAR
jgi:hypothetical protein